MNRFSVCFVAILGLAACQGNKVKLAKTNGCTIQQAATVSFLLADSKCPTVEDLQRERRIDGSTKDPWGQTYAIRCDDGDLVVISSGPNRTSGDADDITIKSDCSQTH